MSNILKTIKAVLPRGRAFNITNTQKYSRKFWDAIAGVSKDVVDAADVQYLDIFPETTTNLVGWESAFGLVATGLTEQQRRDNLLAAWRETGGQSKEYIQAALRAKGFDVYVYDWWIPGGSIPRNADYCEYLLKNKLTFSTLGDDVASGSESAECGGPSAECGGLPEVTIGVEDPIAPEDEERWKHFIYISGPSFGDPISVPTVRRDEFDALVLKLRPLEKWVGVGPRIPTFTPVLTNTNTIYATGVGEEGTFVAVDGPLEREEYLGNMIINTASDGDFASLAEWGDFNSSSTIASNVLTNVGDGTDQTPYVRQTNVCKTVVSGDKIFLSARVRCTNSVCTKLSAFLAYSNRSVPSGITGVVAISSPTNGEWYDIKAIYTFTTSDADWGLFPITLVIEHEYSDAPSALGQEMEIDGVAGVHVLKMGGMYYEGYDIPQMAELVSLGYTPGMVGTGEKKVTSRGKNLFNPDNRELSTYISNTTGLPVSGGSDDATEFIRIEAGEEYTVSGIGSNNTYGATYDAQKNVVQTGLPFNFVADPDVWFMRYSIPKTNVAISQVEKGAPSTPHEPYKSSFNVVPNLCALSETVRDKYLNGIITSPCSPIFRIISGVVISIATIPPSKDNGLFTLVQDDKEVVNGIIDGSYTTTDGGYIVFELEVPTVVDTTNTNRYAYADGSTITEDTLGSGYTIPTHKIINRTN